MFNNFISSVKEEDPKVIHLKDQAAAVSVKELQSTHNLSMESYQRLVGSTLLTFCKKPLSDSILSGGLSRPPDRRSNRLDIIKATQYIAGF